MNTKPTEKPQVIAIVGDVHGHQNRMVAMLQRIEQKRSVAITHVLQVGDFEAHRHEADVATMDAPQKYRLLGDFHQYYQGQMTFPWPLYFIGGNHEPFGWYEQHSQGAELIDHCYYFGRVGALNIGGYKVVGLTGIFHPEKFSVDRPALQNMATTAKKDYVYYTQADLDQAMGYESCDILLLHDWPQNIVHEKDIPVLTRGYGTSEVEAIGNEFTALLVEALKPKVVACGHKHYKYRNTLQFEARATEVCCVANVLSGTDSVILLDDQLNVLD